MPAIPVYINNRNWLTPVRNMVTYLESVPGVEIILIDNGSTYPPLLEWYCQCRHRVVLLNRNGGHQAPWREWVVLPPGAHEQYWGTNYYVVTDPDLSLANVPKNFLDVLADGLARYPSVHKSGLSLEIEDLPKESPLTARIREWERPFWSRRADGIFYAAPIDTTFTLCRASSQFAAVMDHIVDSLRADRPYTARHLPWYLLPNTLTEEERYYLQHAAAGYWTPLMQAWL